MDNDFPEGTRIVLNEEFVYEELAGKEGVIVGELPSVGLETLYAVQFDFDFYALHDCDDLLQSNCGYYVYAREMKKKDKGGLSNFLEKTA